MNENLEKPGNEYADLCGWCGIPLGSANLVSQSTCVRCYKLLKGANVSDEEIFRTRNVKNEGSHHHLNNETEE
jgi:hypothetical protein